MKMSGKIEFLYLNPPLFADAEEHVECTGYECALCKGQGGFAGDRIKPDECEWKICPMCEGSGKMDAEVTIKWKPNKRDKK